MDFTTSQLNDFYNNHGFVLVLMIYNLFKIILNQKIENPTETELKVWILNDYCRHTTLETELTDIQFEGKFRDFRKYF